jgi:hypothetical protein
MNKIRIKGEEMYGKISGTQVEAWRSNGVKSEVVRVGTFHRDDVEVIGEVDPRGIVFVY